MRRPPPISTRLSPPLPCPTPFRAEDGGLPAEFARLDCRNNRLAWLALQQDAMAERIDDLRARHRPERVALVLGTSTSSIGATEVAYARLSDDGLQIGRAHV